MTSGAKWDVFAAELSDTARADGKKTRKCRLCDRATTALSGICADHPGGGVCGDLYQRLMAACCTESGMTEQQIDEHVRGIAAVVASAKERTK